MTDGKPLRETCVPGDPFGPFGYPRNQKTSSGMQGKPSLPGLPSNRGDTWAPADTDRQARDISMKHKMTRRTIWLFFLTLLAVSEGCAFYHPRPLDERAVKESLKAPDKDRIRVQARELKHPILKPIDLDLAKGLTPEGAAVLAVLANPALKAARDKKGVAAAQLLQAGILSNPQLSYNLDFPTWATPRAP